MKTQADYDKDHENAARIPIENFDDPMLVSPEQYDYLVQFKWYWHHLSEEVVTYLDIPLQGTRMVFGAWLALVLAGRAGDGKTIPIHGTNAKNTGLGRAFVTKEQFEKYARRR